MDSDLATAVDTGPCMVAAGADSADLPLAIPVDNLTEKNDATADVVAVASEVSVAEQVSEAVDCAPDVVASDGSGAEDASTHVPTESAVVLAGNSEVPGLKAAAQTDPATADGRTLCSS